MFFILGKHEGDIGLIEKGRECVGLREKHGGKEWYAKGRYYVSHVEQKEVRWYNQPALPLTLLEQENKQSKKNNRETQNESSGRVLRLL
jgi:hypothetical protein